MIKFMFLHLIGENLWWLSPSNSLSCNSGYGSAYDNVNEFHTKSCWVEMWI